MPNRLAQETSPYLRQHAENPVDWYPWGPEALAVARETDKPLLVSIGYAACHWCHVMAHESFEDPAVAELMNERFVCVKVDREERPDIDAVCMDACQRMNGHGGWPLNVFMTPQEEPFFAGTYFPPQQRQGIVSWTMVLKAVSDAWTDRPDAVRDQAAELTQMLASSAAPMPTPEPLPQTAVSDAITSLRSTFDAAHGGWGGAPKFPPHCVLEFLLAGDSSHGVEVALRTLRLMAAGGIYDQIGGGFARYAVDATWTVPHFEKMLYDNALLARAYLHGFQRSGEERLREVCTETLDFCIRELGAPDGGFSSSLDADSEGVEGKFYVWTEAELREALAPDTALADAAVAYFGVRPGGNFEHGTSVLEAIGEPPQLLPEIRARLLEARSARIRPGLDDKQVTAWNALMISALAETGAVLERPDYIAAASRCASLLLSHTPLVRTGIVPAFLDDHAYLVQALVTLYEATFEPRWYTAAVEVADLMIERFADPSGSGFFTTASDQQVLVSRRRDLEDAPIPSGSSAAAFGLLRLARLAGDVEYERTALSVLRAHGPLAVRHPGALGHLLQALHFYAATVREVAIIGDGPSGPLARAVRAEYRPFVVLAGTAAGGDATVPLLEHRGLLDGRPAAYVCERFECKAPVADPQALLALL